MSGLLCVLPVIAPHPTETCLSSALAANNAFEIDRNDILVVDNSRDGFASRLGYGLRTHRDPDGHNIGVAASWNVGAREVLERGLDYLVILSASMQFGPVLHTTWRRQMETFWGSDIIEADGHSWHLIAIHRRLFELIGLFDENFWPGYFEQIDWCTRLRILGREGAWPKVWVNALSQGSALAIEHTDCPAPPLLEYYRQKWGGDKGEEPFVLPWGDKPMGYWEATPIPVMAERYGLKVWW